MNKCNRQTFYVEVCGWETISSTPPNNVMFEQIYNINSGSRYVYNFCTTMFSNNNQANCPITTCQLETTNDNGATFVPYNPLNRPYLQSTSPGAWLKTTTGERHRSIIYIKASSHAGKFARQSFRIEVCGLEIVTSTTPAGTRWERIYELNSGTQTVASFCSSIFSVDNSEKCPITTCVIETSNDDGVTFQSFSDSSKPYLSSSSPTSQINTRTTAAHRTTLYIKASTHYGIFARQPFFVEVCGLEILTTTTSTFTHIFSRDSGTNNLQVNPDRYHSLFANDDAVHCPTTTYTLETSNDNGVTFQTYTANNQYLEENSPTAHFVSKTNVNYHERVYIKASTNAGRFVRTFYDVKVCQGDITPISSEEASYVLEWQPTSRSLISLIDYRTFFSSADGMCDSNYNLLYMDQIQRSYLPYVNSTTGI